MDHLDTRSEFGRLRRPPVDEDGGPVGPDDVAQPVVDPRGVGPHSVGRRASLRPGSHFANALRRAGPRRFATVPPDGNPAPGVVVVGPDQELQAFAAELEMRGQLVDGTPAVFRRPQGRRVHAQLDDDRATSEPVAVELLRRRGRILQRGVVKDDPRARCPAQGWFVSRENHHAAAQLGRLV